MKWNSYPKIKPENNTLCYVTITYPGSSMRDVDLVRYEDGEFQIRDEDVEVLFWCECSIKPYANEEDEVIEEKERIKRTIPETTYVVKEVQRGVVPLRVYNQIDTTFIKDEKDLNDIFDNFITKEMSAQLAEELLKRNLIKFRRLPDRGYSKDPLDPMYFNCRDRIEFEAELDVVDSRGF